MKSWLSVWAVSLCCCSLVQWAGSVSRPSTMYLQNNQYKNMVIALHDSIAENKSLIDTLKATMTKAAKYMYTASRKRAYFKEITILLPSTWSNDASYTASRNESIQQADVVITHSSRKRRGVPQTRSYSGCGKQGAHVLLTQEFLTNPRVDPYFRDSAKFFVHAFAQFRWGVFQEYGERGEQVYYFSMTSGRSEAIRCVYAMRGLIQKKDKTICYSSVDANSMLYTPDCIWMPYPTRQRIKASYMDYQWITAIETFCDDDASSYLTVHNYEAPSKHNRLCSHRSTWDVITNSDDFRGNVNPPVTLTDADLTPTFKVVKATASRKRRAVVAMDTRQLRQNADRMLSIGKAASRILHVTMNDDAEVGIVHSASRHAQSHIRRPRSVQDISEITKPFTDDMLSHSQPFTQVLQQSLMTLSDSADSLEDSTLVVMATCQEYDRSAVDMVKTALDSGVTVHAIVLQDPEFKGDNSLGSLPGVSVCYEGSHESVNTLDDCLHTALSGSLWRHEDHVQVSVKTEMVGPGQDYSDLISIDHTLGKSTSFVVDYIEEEPEVTLTDQLGNVYRMSDAHCLRDKQLRTIACIFSQATTGEWTISISSDVRQPVSIIVKSMYSPETGDPVVIRSQIVPLETNDVRHYGLYADVLKGHHPVIGLGVMATVSDPEGNAYTLELLDNGAGADIAKDDGIYSRYLTRHSRNGRYHVTLSVTGQDGNIFTKEVEIMEDEPGEFLTSEVHHETMKGGLERRINGGDYDHREGRLDTANDSKSLNLPPARVVDLVVSKSLRYRRSAVLTWTATGDDLDSGKVHHYELLVGENIRDIRNILDVGAGKRHTGSGSIRRILIPARHSAGKTETHLLRVKGKTTRSLAVALRGVDADALKGEVSNVATSAV